MMVAQLSATRRVHLAATFVHRSKSSAIEYGFPVAPAGAKRRILMRWIYPDGMTSEWAQDAYTGATTREVFDLWRERLVLQGEARAQWARQQRS